MIRACAKAAKLTNRDGTLKKYLGSNHQVRAWLIMRVWQEGMAGGRDDRRERVI